MKTSKAKTVSAPAVMSLCDWEHDRDNEHGKIPPNVGEGIEWTHERDGGKWRTVLEPNYHFKDGKRIVQLSESSFTNSGVCFAMHYYATLKVRRASCQDLSDMSTGHGGYVGVPKDHPRQFDIGGELSITVQRRLTKVERDMSGDVIGKIGEYTYRFNTPEEARAAAIDMFKHRFAPGWVLVAENAEGDDEIIAVS